VEIYRAAAMRKLGVNHLAHAVRMAVVAGWTPQRSNESDWRQSASA
jgi:hypothetical protein